MVSKLFFSALLLAFGVVAGLWLAPISTPPGPVAVGQNAAVGSTADGTRSLDTSAAPGQANDLDSLRQALETEIDARRRLAQQVDELRRQLAGLQAQTLPQAAPREAAAEAGPAPAADNPQDWFNAQALIDSGMDSAQAAELKRYFEQLEIERLVLRDRAERENWSRQQLREAMRAVDDRENDLKSQLSESAYDAYLYASGQTNRVAITSVLDSAQAGTAGIKAGDHIIRYDNQRIYNWSDLRTATTGGNIGEAVTLEIERDGRRIEFFLARGPLGIRTSSLSIAP